LVTRLEFGFSISPGEPRGVAAEVAHAESLGYDRAGIWDSPALFRDPWVVLAGVASNTRRIRLGTWVTNPQARHPVVTASALASIDDLARGRTYLGIGSGGTGVLHLGLNAASLEQLEQYVLTVRELLHTGQATFNGKPVRLRWAKRRIPIILAAHGPKAIRLAGRIADGVVLGLGVTPEVVSGCLELLDQGAREAGRHLDDIEVWFTCFWFVDKAPGVAKKQGAWAATSFASHFAGTGVEGKFVPREYREELLRLGAAYDYLTHGTVPDEQKEQYAELARELGVSEYLQRRFAFAGTPDEVEAQIRAGVAAGAHNFDGAIDAELPEHGERITKWARLVLPRFRGLDGEG
jgi:5,10-methylenetetrahydromethanopterin reductase